VWLKVVTLLQLFFMGKLLGSDCVVSEQSSRNSLCFCGPTSGAISCVLHRFLIVLFFRPNRPIVRRIKLPRSGLPVLDNECYGDVTSITLRFRMDHVEIRPRCVCALIVGEVSRRLPVLETAICTTQGVYYAAQSTLALEAQLGIADTPE
jgi:hypothetical protein